MIYRLDDVDRLDNVNRLHKVNRLGDVNKMDAVDSLDIDWEWFEDNHTCLPDYLISNKVHRKKIADFFIL